MPSMPLAALAGRASAKVTRARRVAAVGQPAVGGVGEEAGESSEPHRLPERTCLSSSVETAPERSARKGFLQTGQNCLVLTAEQVGPLETGRPEMVCAVMPASAASPSAVSLARIDAVSVVVMTG